MFYIRKRCFASARFYLKQDNSEAKSFIGKYDALRLFVVETAFDI